MTETLTCECVVPEMRFVHLGTRCDRCGSPMHRKEDQEFPFCWECVVNRENAHRGRTLLAMAKLAAQGIFLRKDHTRFDEGSPF